MTLCVLPIYSIMADSNLKNGTFPNNWIFVVLRTLVFLITDQAPNNHPGHQNSGFSGAMALIAL